MAMGMTKDECRQQYLLRAYLIRPAVALFVAYLIGGG